jgi:hypothetical protein
MATESPLLYAPVRLRSNGARFIVTWLGTDTITLVSLTTGYRDTLTLRDFAIRYEVDRHH